MPRDSALHELEIDPRSLRGKDALAYLATELRKPMPVGFVWSFDSWLRPHESIEGVPSMIGKCGFTGCAIGLMAMKEIAGISFDDLDRIRARGYRRAIVLKRQEATKHIAARLGLGVDAFECLFECASGRDWTKTDDDPILPTDVADAIDGYLATGAVYYGRRPEIHQASV